LRTFLATEPVFRAFVLPFALKALLCLLASRLVRLDFLVDAFFAATAMCSPKRPQIESPLSSEACAQERRRERKLKGRTAV